MRISLGYPTKMIVQSNREMYLCMECQTLIFSVRGVSSCKCRLIRRTDEFPSVWVAVIVRIEPMPEVDIWKMEWAEEKKDA